MSAVQFTGTLGPHAVQRWFTFNWSPTQDVDWQVVPTTAKPGAPQIDWDVAIERASATTITYWITITNLSGDTIDFEARYQPIP